MTTPDPVVPVSALKALSEQLIKQQGRASNTGYWSAMDAYDDAIERNRRPDRLRPGGPATGDDDGSRQMIRPPILSLCDVSGKAVKPWADAGYPCFIVDVQHPRGVSRGDHPNVTRIGASVYELHPYHMWMPKADRFALGMAWPECTHSVYSGARWRRENGPMATADGFRLFAACWDLLRFYERERGAAWLLENPKGIVWSWSKPNFVFDPWQYGDNYTKETGIWCGGEFVMPAPTVLLKPQGDVRADIHMAAPGPERANIRSATPEGFARAVFESNHPLIQGRAA
jgi:hypothetical protein